MATARALWIRFETIHAITYFAPESHDAARASGLKGFWMGYFGFRAAPLGAVGPDEVTAAFFNFAPRMVERAIPDAWGYARPEGLIEARRAAAAAALRRVVPDVDGVAAELVAELGGAAQGPHLGPDHPLGSANQALPDPADPVESLWQRCTTLREHRGDTHVAALRAAALDGCRAHALLAAAERLPDALLRDNRGWEAAEWEQARSTLADRGLLAPGGEITAAGRSLRAEVEAATDLAGMAPFGESVPDAVVNALDPVAGAVEHSGLIPYPNPMGLPRLT